MQRLCALTILILGLSSLTSAQVTLNVPTQSYLTIQAGLNAAQNGDTVLVGPGIYVETNLDFQGKDVILKSSSGAAQTTIDGNFTGRVFSITSGEGSGCMVQGFTIRQGRAPDGADGTSANRSGGVGANGGAMLIINSSPTIVDCRFDGNVAGAGGAVFSPGLGEAGENGGDGGAGGGIYIDNGSPNISNCEFLNNTGGAGSPGQGSGFMTLAGGLGNGMGGQGGQGGAIYVKSGGPQISSVTFTSNFGGVGGEGSNAASLGGRAGAGGIGGHGGGIYLDSGITQISDCIFVMNEGGLGGDSGFSIGSVGDTGGHGGNGGGLFAETNASVNLSGSSFDGNVAGVGGDGGLSSSFFSIIGTAGPGGSGGHGGGIFANGIVTADNLTITNNAGGLGGIGGEGFSIISGRGGDGGSGGGIFVDSGVVVMTNVLLAHNISGQGGDAGNSSISSIAGGGMGGSGAGVAIIGGALNFANGIIFENANSLAGLGGIGHGVPGIPGVGAGIITTGGVLDVANSVVRGNNTNAISNQLFDTGGGTVSVSFTNFEGSTAGPGIIDLDPMFVDAANNDFHLLPNSPCRDAGDQNTGILALQNFEGDPRVVCNQVDMGIDEFSLGVTLLGQAPRVGIAVFDIDNGARNANDCSVASNSGGPFEVKVAQGANFVMNFEGEPWQAIIVVYGNRNPQSAVYTPFIGQFDCGGAPDPLTGFPTGLVAFADGTEVYVQNRGFYTDLQGLGNYAFTMPSFPLGVLTTFQAVIFRSGGCSITNAIEIEIIAGSPSP